MRGGLVDDAVRAFARDEALVGLAALDHELGRLHVQPALGGGLVVAGDAVVFQEGMYLLVVIDYAGSSMGGDDEGRMQKDEGTQHDAAKYATRRPVC